MEFKVGDKVKFIGEVENHRVPGKGLQADIEKYNNSKRKFSRRNYGT